MSQTLSANTPYSSSPMLTKLTTWFRSLLSGVYYQLIVEHNQDKQPTGTTTNKIQSQLEGLRTGDLVEVVLLPSFCQNMLLQAQERFDQQDLSTRKLSGVVFTCAYRIDIRCHVLELLTAKRLGDAGVAKFVYSIAGDELESVKKVGNA